jgi:uncharacterized Zn finger protein
MTAATTPRFDVDAVRDFAGGKTFARGEGCFAAGQVTLLVIEPERVVAEVAGTEDYHTELLGSGEEIDGTCSCPAFENSGFCKHMVAVALAVNAAPSHPAAGEANMLGRIRSHLAGLGLDALVEMIVDLAERDSALLRRLDISAAASQGDDGVAIMRLRKALEAATRTRGFVEYREARNWALGVEEVLDTIAGLVPAGRGSVALAAAEHALDRIADCMGAIDDSDGHCGALMHRAQDIHLDAARAVRPEPVGLARNLFERETNDAYDVFAGAAEGYEDVLGEAGLAEYRRLAMEAWRTVPSSPGGRRGTPATGHSFALRGILDFFAERDGDIDARIALRAANLTTAWSYLGIARFCEQMGRQAEALRWAEEGLWMFEDERPDERLLFFVAERLAQAGRTADAEAHLWRTFGKAPSLECFARLRTLGGDAARDRALALLEADLASARRPTSATTADLLVRIQMREGRHDAAWATVRLHGASKEVKEALARDSEATHPAEAVQVYRESVERLAAFGGDDSYRKAVDLLARMGALRGADEHATDLAAIKARHGRKRNFMKLLG